MSEEFQVEQSLSQKISRNTIYNIIGHLWSVLASLFLTPYIISRIGIERFGIWAIIGVITGYFGLFDFGIGTSFVKYIAEFYIKNDYKKINQIINSGFIFYSIFSILIIVLAFSSIDLLLIFFKIPPYLHSEAKFIFLFGVILFAFSSTLSTFGAIQGGLQRMDISNKAGIIISLPVIIGTIYFLELGYGLRGLIVNNAIILLLTAIINIIIAFRILPTLKFNPFIFDRKTYKMLFGFGIKRWITNIEQVILSQMDKLLISYFLNYRLVGLYQLGSTIVNKAGQLPMLLIPAIVPAASELDARHKKETIVKLYLQGSKYLLCISIPMFTFLFSASHLIMLAWMGEGYQVSVLVTVLC